MSMEMTWLDFQLSTDQNGRHIATRYFFRLFSEFPWNLVYTGFRGLRVYNHCPTETEATGAILVSSIVLIFSWMPWNLAYISFRDVLVYRHCLFSCAIQTEAVAAILILSLIFYYWHNVLQAVVSDFWTFGVTASAERFFSFLQHILVSGHTV